MLSAQELKRHYHLFDHIRNTTTEETWKSILKDLSDKKTHLEVCFDGISMFELRLSQIEDIRDRFKTYRDELRPSWHV